MNIRSHYEEIGLLETVRLLEKHRDDPDLMAECTEWLPAVQGGLARRLSGIAEEIRRLGKKKAAPADTGTGTSRRAGERFRKNFTDLYRHRRRDGKGRLREDRSQYS